MTPPNGSGKAIGAQTGLPTGHGKNGSNQDLFFFKPKKCLKSFPLVITFKCKLKDLFAHVSGMPISVPQLSPGKH